MPQPIGVFSADPSLVALLRRACPACSFATQREEAEICRIIIVDTDSAAVLENPPRKSIVKIGLFEETASAPRRSGEIRVSRREFLANPSESIQVASDLADTVLHAAQLETEVSYLTQIQELITMLEAEAVSERVTRSVLNIIGLPRAVLLLHDPRLERYVISFSNDPEFQETGEFLAGVPPRLLHEAISSGILHAYDPEARLIIVALEAGQDLIGVIRIPVPDDAGVDEAAREQLRRFVRSVVQVLGNVYMQTRSRDLAMRDDLTKAFNRRFFEQCLDEEIERSRRYGSVFSIIFLDLDDLKTVNNFHGHLTGSRILQEVAKRILGAVRGIDKVVRFGGDEFCVILPQTDFEQAAAVANRIRKALNGDKFHIEPDIEVSITASFGIATYPTHAIEKEDLVRQADAAMYRVKSTTKNAVGIATVENATRPKAI
jgi:diguanylate cyclase (GGDEF)-like protein